MHPDIQHPHGRTDGGEHLIGMDATGAQLAALGLPGDAAFGERVGAPALGDANLVVDQRRQRQPLTLENPPERVGEGIEATIAGPGPGEDLLTEPDPDSGHGLQIQTRGHGAGQQFGVVVVLALQHLGDDEGQILGGDGLLGIPSSTMRCKTLRWFSSDSSMSSRSRFLASDALPASLPSAYLRRRAKRSGESRL